MLVNFLCQCFLRCLHVWLEEFNMKWSVPCPLHVSSAVHVSHVVTCLLVCSCLFVTTQLRTKKPNSASFKLSHVTLKSMFTGELAVKCLHLCVPRSMFLFFTVWFDFRNWAMSGVWHIETYCCNWQFILHTHPQADCSQVYTQQHADTHSLRQMVHTHTQQRCLEPTFMSSL